MGLLKLLTGSNSKLVDFRLSEPLSGAKTATVDIHTGAGNLTIEPLTGSKPELVSGILQYPEDQNPPAINRDVKNGHAALSVKSTEAGQPWYRFPWAACNGAIQWQINVNPAVSLDLTARSGGGNVKLDLASVTVTKVEAHTGGGNVEVVMPDKAADCRLTAKTGGGNVTIGIGRSLKGNHTVNAASGAGNVIINIPNDLEAKLHLNTGLGKTIVDPRFKKIDDHTYQSSGYDQAASKIEITAQSGAGNVSVNLK